MGSSRSIMSTIIRISKALHISNLCNNIKIINNRCRSINHSSTNQYPMVNNTNNNNTTIVKIKTKCSIITINPTINKDLPITSTTTKTNIMNNQKRKEPSTYQ